MLRIKLFILFLLSTGIFYGFSTVRDTLDLSGYWYYRLTGAPSSIPGEGEISLPNTLDIAHKSVYQPHSENTSQLRREFSFAGTSNYYRDIEIPESWKGKKVYLHLERTKPSVVKLEGKEIGRNSRISSPQKFDLTDYLSQGKHRLEILINNADSIPPIVARSSNATSESTQTNWNGVLGKIFLEATNPFHVKDIRIDDSSVPDKINLEINFSEGAPLNHYLTVRIDDKEEIHELIDSGTSSLTIPISVSETELWSAQNPVLHDITVKIEDRNKSLIDEKYFKTGFRTISSINKDFNINGEPLFLRGTVNSAIFPLTAYSPADIQYWIDYFTILKNYGLNHVRFHSWTPPPAAFEAADRLGIYILAELPIWGELDRDLQFHNRFLKEELKGIMEAYSIHPSFIMFSPGNELWGDLSLMGEYMKDAKALNPRILSTYGSNVYLGMNGQIGDEDFILSAKTGDSPSTSVRGSNSFADSPDGGWFNSSYPGNNYDFSPSLEGIGVPVISHEVGQYQSYPDFSDIDSYTGILKPDNLKVFKSLAEEVGNARKSKEFNLASGKWAAKLYKAEMEMAQRTPGIGGFELFGLQDYPGQGTALIGILNTFMDSKGFINPQDWKHSTNDVIILAELPKFTFTEGETVEVPLLKINFSRNQDTLPSIFWSTGFEKGIVRSPKGKGRIKSNSIILNFPKISKPQTTRLTLSDEKGTLINSYDIWVYPKKFPPVDNVKVTDNINDALTLLEKGERVIFYPDSSLVSKSSIGPLFTPDFWNYRMFKSICDEMGLTPSPGTLGLYINSRHPALNKFPSDIHTDWQWYPIVANSRPLIIDRLPKDFDPIVEVIDNVERNFRLSLILECNVGKGKLILLSFDIKKASEYPEGKWLLQSLKEYAASKDFKPKLTLTPEQLVNLLTKPSTSRLIKELKNETFSTKWEE